MSFGVNMTNVFFKDYDGYYIGINEDYFIRESYDTLFDCIKILKDEYDIDSLKDIKMYCIGMPVKFGRMLSKIFAFK